MPILFNSVRGGPHRPFISGSGDSSVDASLVHVVYESRQCYPAFVVELDVGGAAAAALEAPSPAPAAAKRPNSSSTAAPAAKRAKKLQVNIINKFNGETKHLFANETTTLGKVLDAYAEKKGVNVEWIRICFVDVDNGAHYDFPQIFVRDMKVDALQGLRVFKGEIDGKGHVKINFFKRGDAAEMLILFSPAGGS